MVNGERSHFGYNDTLRRTVLLVLWLGWGCGSDVRDNQPPEQRVSPPASRRAPSTTGTILFVGTSLTAGYGLGVEQAYPALIQGKIDSAGLPYRVVNAGVSGETSAGARRRIEWLLRQPAAVLVLEAGANDGLRGQHPESLKANLESIIDRTRQLSPATRVVLLAMEAPPNLGFQYARRFRAVYGEVAKEKDVTLVPFFLKGIAGVARLNQIDGIHPTAEGQRMMAEKVWKVLKNVLGGER